MQGIRNGACDYLVKPVRIQELQNIWQHVVRRNKSMPVQRITGGSTRAVTLNVTQGAIHRGKSIEDSSGDENNDDDEIEESGRENEDSSTQKKPRLFWSVDLHQKFVDAVNQLGLDSKYRYFFELHEYSFACSSVLISMHSYFLLSLQRLSLKRFLNS